MINKLRLNILDITKNNKLGITHTNLLMIYFINIKYLIEKGTYKYEDILIEEHLIEIDKEITRINKYWLRDEKIYIHRLLKDYKDITSKELLIKYLDSLNSPIRFNDNKEESIFIVGLYRLAVLFYDRFGNTTYVNSNKNVIACFDQYKLFDEILGVNNKYMLLDDVKVDNYKYLYIYDSTPRYRSNRYDNEYTIIDKYIDKIDNIILYTNYNKINNVRACKDLLKYMKTIILDNSRAIIIFNKDINDKISIINYDSNKISKDKVLSIVKNNRKQKDVLTKTSLDEIRKNNYRIGFNLYQLENNNKVKDINKIVDENTAYLEQLNRINKIVETEINKLMNK